VKILDELREQRELTAAIYREVAELRAIVERLEARVNAQTWQGTAQL
jgi:hypothetical protein